MLRRGRGRPRKHFCSDRTLTSLQKVEQLKRTGKVLYRKQLTLRHHRLLELANANFCSTISKQRRSLREVKRFARQLGKGQIPPLSPSCQQRASGILADFRVSSQCGHGHVDWNSSGSGDIASRNPTSEANLRSRENQDSGFVNDAHVDQWVGVEVILCGRKSSIGEVGSTTSNVCDELRSVIVDLEREQLCASFSKNLNQASNVEPELRTVISNRREEEEGRVWTSASKHGVVPSWLTCRRNITRKRRINASGGISDCHITALIASLPKTGNYIGDKATSAKTIASTEENGLPLCADAGAVISLYQSSTAVISVDRSSEAVIPMEQSFASQESNVNSGQGSSLDFGQEKQANNCVQRDAIQVCPTTPEKAQKRRRNYQDTIPDLDVRGIDGWKQSNDRVPTGTSDLCPSADDNGGKDTGGGLALMTDFILSPYSVEFESSCNSTGIGELGLNVTGVELPRSLVNSIPTPAMPDSIDNISLVFVNAVREGSQLLQTQVPSTTVFDMDSERRKEERVTFKLNKNVGCTAIVPKVRKKYKPRVAKDKPTHNNYGSRLGKRTAGNTMDHGAFEHERTEVVRRQINRGGVQRGMSARNSCTSHGNFCGNDPNYPGTIGESRGSFYQEDTMELRIGERTSIPVKSTSPCELPSSIDYAYLTRNVFDEDWPRAHPPEPSNLEHDRIEPHSVLCTSCGLERRIMSDRPEIGQAKQINNLFPSSEDPVISNSVIGRQEHFEALSVALANRVLALLGLPSTGQSRSIAGEVQESHSIRASDFVRCYTEAALRKYTNEGDFSLFGEEWSASHSALESTALNTLSAETTALDALLPERTALDASNEEAIDFDLFYKEHLSAGLEDTLMSTLNAELNQYDPAISDSRVRGSHFTKDQCGVQDLLCKTNSRIEEPGLGACKQSNLCPSPVWRPRMTQLGFPESAEDRTMSSFYASTSAGVTNIMLSRLNEMIEQNIEQNGQQGDTWKELPISVKSDRGETAVPSTCSEQRTPKSFKDLGLLEDHSHGKKDLVLAGDMVLCHRSSQFQNSDPDSNFATDSSVVAAEFSSDREHSSDYIFSPDKSNLNQVCPRNKICPAKTPFRQMTYAQLVAYIKIILTNSSEMSPLQLLRHVQDHLQGDEKIEFEKLWPMILHPVNSEQLAKLADLAEIDLPPCMETIQDQQVEGQDDGGDKNNHLAPSIEVLQDERTRGRGAGANDGNRLPPCIEAFQCQQIERWDEGATKDNHLPPSLEMIQEERVKRRDDGTNEGNYLPPHLEVLDCQQGENVFHWHDGGRNDIHFSSCKEIIQYRQVERRGDVGRRDHHLASCMEIIPYQRTKQRIERRKDKAKDFSALVPYVGNVGNAIVVFDGPFFPLRKRKPRPKVYLDTETIRVWKLLMGKSETTESDPDMDNELKWKQERILMQEQAESFIRRMHSIQGDRSFSRWKGSVVDSVVGVFLTQNVSDVLSSSAFMYLRARFPSRKFLRPVQSKSPGENIGEILQDDVQFDTAPIQTLEEAQISSSHEVSFSCASTIFTDERRQENPNSLESCHEMRDTPNPETREFDTSLSLGSESHASLTSECHQEGIVLNSQHKQPPTTDTSVNVSATASELNVTSSKCAVITNASGLEIMREDTLFISGNESQGSLISSLEQGQNRMRSNQFSENNLESSACCIPNVEYILTEEVMMSGLESQLELLLLQHETDGGNGAVTNNNLTKELQKEDKLVAMNVVLTGPERARMEAEQVRARKSLKWELLAEKYNARCQQAAKDSAPLRSEMTEDGVDWEAVRCADLEEIADAIKERGMNWKLAGRIKGFLERLRLEQGGIDLEWLRSIPNDDAKEFLSSIHGLGLKSVECIRLLALHQNAFPVDTNVGRICVRLGWVPLEPLPEELQLHVLELYPVQATIQKYLWPRLCTLDQQTLYELHYQLITFGKVFCTKSKPNCNACPMRSDCKHFASALSSAKLALPAPDRTSGSEALLALPSGSCSDTEVGESPPQLAKTVQPSMCMSQYCQPIVEEPMTPESEADMSDCDIEDYPFSVEEISSHDSTMELYRQESQGRQEMHKCASCNRCCQPNLPTTLPESEIAQEMDIGDSETLADEEAQPKRVSSSLDSTDMVVNCAREGGNVNLLTRDTVLFRDPPSREVVMLAPEAASIPVPKLKNIERLRTVHYVYELPDNHPLLDGMDIREADDPCFYLLAIWSPGEVPESIPNINDDNEEASFASCNFSSDEESINGTLLVPCRTAMQGSFPLNGTYFQVNEVFADHQSSLQPVQVPRVMLWNLRRRYVYFGTSVTSILRGMTAEEIKACFRRGYVCVRGFDRMTRAPKPLVGRLHFQTTKAISRSAPIRNIKT